MKRALVLVFAVACGGPEEAAAPLPEPSPEPCIDRIAVAADADAVQRIMGNVSRATDEHDLDAAAEGVEEAAGHVRRMALAWEADPIQHAALTAATESYIQAASEMRAASSRVTMAESNPAQFAEHLDQATDHILTASGHLEDATARVEESTDALDSTTVPNC